MPVAALAAGTIGSSIIGALGANSAAGKQSDAALQAAQLQSQDANNALNFQKQQYGNSLQMLNPYLQRGYQGLNLLSYGMGLPGNNAPGFTLNQPQTSPLSMRDLSTIDLPALRQRLGGGSGPAPMQASAMGGMVPAAGGSFNPGESFSGGPGMVNLAGEGGAPGGAANPVAGVTSASNGTLQVPIAGASTGGTDASGNPNLSFGSLLSPFSEQFKPPTVTDDPGYQFRLQQGMNALNNSAAAKGNLLSGGFAKELNDYAQGSASQEYQNAYNRSLDQYLNRANLFFQNQNSQFNKLADISGMGQTAGNQLSASGLTAGGQIGNTLLTSGQQIGNDLTNAGAARASGITGMTNAITGGMSSLGNLALISQLLGQGGGSGVPSGGNGVF